MKSLIIASGNLGSTVKAGRMLADMLGDATVLDTANPVEIAAAGYDCYVFGANIRMFRINRRMKKWMRKLKKEMYGKRIFIYLVGVDNENVEKYCEKARKIIPAAEDVVHVWGELNAEHAKGMAKAVIASVAAGLQKDGKEMPQLLGDKLRGLADRILEGDRNAKESER